MKSALTDRFQTIRAALSFRFHPAFTITKVCAGPWDWSDFGIIGAVFAFDVGGVWEVAVLTVVLVKVTLPSGVGVCFAESDLRNAENLYNLAQLDGLDGRQCRSVPPCGWGEADACAAAYDPSVTMLGDAQEKWALPGDFHLAGPLDLLGNDVMLGRLDHDGGAGERLWHGSGTTPGTGSPPRGNASPTPGSATTSAIPWPSRATGTRRS